MLETSNVDMICDLIAAYLDIQLIYLVMFNLFQWVGYSMVFFMLIFHVLRDGPGKGARAVEIPL